MKEFIQNSLASFLRFLLTAFSAWVTTKSGYELLTGDPSGIALGSFITGLLVVGLVIALKYIDGTKYGMIGKLVIGPRVVSIAASMSRLIVVAITSALAAIVDVGAFDTLEPGLSDDPVVGLVVLLCGLAYDWVSKLLAP